MCRLIYRTYIHPHNLTFRVIQSCSCCKCVFIMDTMQKCSFHVWNKHGIRSVQQLSSWTGPNCDVFVDSSKSECVFQGWRLSFTERGVFTAIKTGSLHPNKEKSNSIRPFYQPQMLLTLGFYCRKVVIKGKGIVLFTPAFQDEEEWEWAGAGITAPLITFAGPFFVKSPECNKGKAVRTILLLFHCFINRVAN